MSTFQKILGTAAFVVMGSLTLQAQQAFSATSHSATIQGNTYEYVIGEMAVIQTDRNSKLIVTQGFLQPNTSNKPSDVSGFSSESTIKVYPNPTEDKVVVESLEKVEGSFSYQLFDVTGKVLQNETMNGISKFTVDVSSYASGNYYIVLSKMNADGSDKRFSFKIQKK